MNVTPSPEPARAAERPPAASASPGSRRRKSRRWADSFGEGGGESGGGGGESAAERRAQRRVETHARCLQPPPPQCSASPGQETSETELLRPPGRQRLFPRPPHPSPLLPASLAEPCRNAAPGAVSPSRGKAVTPPRRSSGAGWR
ncbi:uncharacterized protein LOC128627483 [Artibeus jamaicensis]|uniref:uncharacterized protein LOC128627483 n=1 Tax=Artibeus jamaicensis TaxID=9417 RepID=UPI00235AA982|nr:uncharacterized protein LOC128627483 [Artibeus jamaicensis]